MKSFAFLIIYLASPLILMAQQNTIIRKDLEPALIAQYVNQVSVQEITFPPGQTAPKHLHPCPVVGYIKSGVALFQIDGQEPVLLKEGDTFYEPKDAHILHFDNASQTEPMTFIAFYLKEEDEANVKILD